MPAGQAMMPGRAMCASRRLCACQPFDHGGHRVENWYFDGLVRELQLARRKVEERVDDLPRSRSD